MPERRRTFSFFRGGRGGNRVRQAHLPREFFAKARRRVEAAKFPNGLDFYLEELFHVPIRPPVQH